MSGLFPSSLWVGTTSVEPALVPGWTGTGQEAGKDVSANEPHSGPAVCGPRK